MSKETLPPRNAPATDSILQKLIASLRSDGDFPVRTQVVVTLKRLAENSNTPIHKMTEVILKDPSLGTRVLHLVNSAYYHGVRNITTVSEAITRLGMQQIADMCAGVVLLQRFLPHARRGGIFADNIKKSMLTALLTKEFAERNNEPATEQAYLAGTFFSLGHLLLAYYFPQVYEAAARRRASREIHECVTELLGITPEELSAGVIAALEIPSMYSSLILEAHEILRKRDTTGAASSLAASLALADRVSETLVSFRTPEEVGLRLTDMAIDFAFPEDALFEIVRGLPEQFAKHSQEIGMKYLALPEFVKHLQPFDEIQRELAIQFVATQETTRKQRLQAVEQAVLDGEPFSSVLTLALETLIQNLGFSRVYLLMLATNHRELRVRLALGNTQPEDRNTLRIPSMERQRSRSPIMKALFENTVEHQGDSAFDPHRHAVAIPVGSEGKRLGVIYADRESEIADRAIQEEMMQPIDQLFNLLQETFQRDQGAG